MFKLKHVVVALSVAFSFNANAETPVVFWHSQPVSPGETVMSQGHAFVQDSLVVKVLIQRLPDAPTDQPPQFDPSVASVIVPTKNSGNTLYFSLPKEAEQGVFAYRLIRENGEQSEINYLNKPEVWFAHGNRGDRATAGGWLAFFGNSLLISTERAPTLRLVGTNGSYLVEARRDAGNRYAQYFDLPADLVAGDYKAYLHNGFGDGNAWTEYAGFDTKPLTTVRVESASWGWESTARQRVIALDSRCAADSEGYWDDCLKTALDDFTMAQGGVLKLSERNYKLRRTIVLPDKVIVSGAGKGKSVLQWDGVPSGCKADGSLVKLNLYPQDQGDSLRPLVRGALINWIQRQGIWTVFHSTFSMEDLSILQTSRALLANQCPGASTALFPSMGIARGYTENGDTSLDRSGRFERIEVKVPNETADSAQIISESRGVQASILRLRQTRNTQILDSDFDGPVGPMSVVNSVTKDGVSLAANSYVRFEGNTIRWRYTPFQTDGIKNLTFANNRLVMAGSEGENGFPSGVFDIGEVISSYGYNLRDIFHASNTYSREEQASAPWRALSLTFDGIAGVYSGQVQSSANTTVSLAGNISKLGMLGTNPTERAEKGAVVQILSGRGAGQWRHLMSTALPTNELTVDRPWDVEPDNTSWLTVTDFFGRMIFADDEYVGLPRIQPYFFSHDVIFSGNKFGAPGSDNAGLFSWSGDHGGHYAANTGGWHLQVLDNTIQHSPATFYDISNTDDITKMTDAQKADLKLLGMDVNYAGPRARTHVFRNNRIDVSNPYSFSVRPSERTVGFLVEQNRGLGYIEFKPTAKAPVDGMAKNNFSFLDESTCTAEGNSACRFAQFVGMDGYRFPISFEVAPFSDVLIANTTQGNFNLARSGFASAATGNGPWERLNAIDGVTTGNFSQQYGAASLNANQPWLQVDTRSNAIIRKIVLWPRTDAYVTQGVSVLVSKTPFQSNDLATEKSRPGVFSIDVPGVLAQPETIMLPNAGFEGRYVRVWKAFPGQTTGHLCVAEIEVYGAPVVTE